MEKKPSGSAKQPSIFQKLFRFIRGEFAKLKPMTAKERWEYYCMYYLIPTIVVLFVGFFAVGGVITGIVNSQYQTQLYVQLVGSTNTNYAAWVQTYQQDRGYTDKQLLKLSQGQYYDGSHDYATVTSVFAATDSLDVLICEDSNLEGILKMGLAGELSNAFTSDFLNERLCYTEFNIVSDADGSEETLSGYYYVDITDTYLADFLGLEGNAYLLKCYSTERHEETEAFFEYVLTQEHE